MSLKKKLGMGIGTAILGLSLIGGGTFAYFSDTEVSNHTFAAGELDLAVNPSMIVEVENLKPGDTIERPFTLVNKGTLDISKVLLETSYTAKDENNMPLKDDFGKHIRVNFLENKSKSSKVISSTTLHELQEMSPDVVKILSESLNGPKGGIEAGHSNDFIVQFEFVDNKKDQNVFQKAKLELDWTFNSEQTAGEER